LAATALPAQSEGRGAAKNEKAPHGGEAFETVESKKPSTAVGLFLVSPKRAGMTGWEEY
jgi:hypothetical protein